MCTGITVTTKNNDIILARTGDWINMDEPAKVTFVPRNFHWEPRSSSESFNSKFALIGISVNQSKSLSYPVFSDGVNEKGLMCASFWLDDACYFSFKEGKHNLECIDIIFWILSQFSSVEDVRNNLSLLNVLNSEPSIYFNSSMLAHWMLNDKSGKSIIIEQTKLGIQIYDDSIGTITNEPIYAKHLCNLYEYYPYNPEIFDLETSHLLLVL